ncbi:unnamed protein product, partial [marine sediment metagenome]
GECPISFNDPNLFDRCFYCLKHIQKLNPPENIKESSPPLIEKIKSKKGAQKLF